MTIYIERQRDALLSMVLLGFLPGTFSVGLMAGKWGAPSDSAVLPVGLPRLLLEDTSKPCLACIHTYVYLYVRTDVHTCMYVYMCMYIHICVYTCMCMYMYMYTNTRIHEQMH